MSVTKPLLLNETGERIAAALEGLDSTNVVAPKEKSPATAPHAQGSQIIVSGDLYDVIAPIAAGDTLAVGTNIQAADDVTTQIATVNQTLTNQVTDIYEVMGQNGAKNLFPLDLKAIKNTSGNTSGTWDGDAYTINGITYTFNGDGTITGNGTASANARIMLISDNGGGKSPCFLKPETGYILSCENIKSIGGKNTGAILGINEWDGTQYVSSPTVGDYTGVNELEFTTKSSAITESMRALLEVKSGVTLNNFVFKPMVRLALDIDPTFQPFAETNQQLTAKTDGLQENLNANGCKNVLPLSLSFIKKINVNGTWSGNVYSLNNANFTIDADGDTVKKITVSTTAATSAAANLRLVDNTVPKAIKAGKYALSKGNTTSNTTMFYNAYNNTTIVRQIAAAEGGNAYAECNIDYSDYNTQMIALGLPSGATASDVVFYPMICLLSEYLADPTFATYAKSNGELTDKVTNAWIGKPRTGWLNLGNKTTLTITVPITPYGDTYMQGSIKLFGYNNNVLIDCSLAFILSRNNDSVAGSKLSNYSDSAVTLGSIAADGTKVTITLENLTTYVNLQVIYGTSMNGAYVDNTNMPEWTFN